MSMHRLIDKSIAQTEEVIEVCKQAIQQRDELRAQRDSLREQVDALNSCVLKAQSEVATLHMEHNQLRARLDEALAVLEECGRYTDHEMQTERCICCHARKHHAPDCRLVKVLKGERK